MKTVAGTHRCQQGKGLSAQRMGAQGEHSRRRCAGAGRCAARHPAGTAGAGCSGRGRAHRHDSGPAGAYRTPCRLVLLEQHTMPRRHSCAAARPRRWKHRSTGQKRCWHSRYYSVKTMERSAYMELFDKNGCLTDEGLQALQAGGLDELGRWKPPSIYPTAINAWTATPLC